MTKDGYEIANIKREIAHEKGYEIAEMLLDEIKNKSTIGKSNLTLETAVYACASAMVSLVQYTYRNKEDEFDDDLNRAYLIAARSIVPMLGKPQPCGKCRNCKQGKICANPKADMSLLKLSKMAMLSEEMIDYIITATTVAEAERK